MATIQRILVPVDGSVSSAKAAEKGKFYADKCGAELHLLYVASEIQKDIPSSIIFDEIMKELPPGLVVKTHERAGNIADEILTKADDIAASMIIMGSRGLGIFKGALIGSVSQQVVERSMVPVMIVKADND